MKRSARATSNTPAPRRRVAAAAAATTTIVTRSRKRAIEAEREQDDKRRCASIDLPLEIVQCIAEQCDDALTYRSIALCCRALATRLLGNPVFLDSAKRRYTRTRTTEYSLCDIRRVSMRLPNGTEHGTFLHYHIPTGSLRSRIEFVDGKRHGVDEEWYLNGVLFTRSHYVNNRKCGPDELWHVNGTQVLQQFYFNDEPHGQWIEWNKYGVLVLTQTWDHGKLCDQLNGPAYGMDVSLILSEISRQIV